MTNYIHPTKRDVISAESESGFCEFYPTLQKALARCHQIRQVVGKELFCVIDGPEDNFAVMLQSEALDAGFEKEFWY